MTTIVVGVIGLAVGAVATWVIKSKVYAKVASVEAAAKAVVADVKKA